ncbi:MAG: hypothetical protein Q8P05_04960 [Candidatus Diapherotrites archaeon]|nr:hypothetical protein [Candidatus Diapherotrites archaeon]
MESTSTVKEQNEKTFFTLPSQVMKSCNIKPFMCAEMSLKDKRIILSSFEKLVDLKVNLKTKTLEILQEYRRRNGYASLDEAITNFIGEHWSKKKTKTVYIYPEGFIESGYERIEQYRKEQDKGKQ